MAANVEPQNNANSDQTLSTQEFDQLYFQGDRNLRQGNFTEAIEVFEQLFHAVTEEHKQYFNLQRSLAKAYQGNQQTEQAILLCQQMVASNITSTCVWGQNFLTTLAPEIHQDILLAQSNQQTEAAADGDNKNFSPRLKPKSLSEFKQYCQDNLLEQLKELEINRKRTLWTIFISGIVCLIVTWCFCQIILNYLRVDNSTIFYLACLTFPLSVWVVFCRGCIQVYGLGFKRNIIEQIIGFIGDEQLNYASHLFLEDKRQAILAFTRSQIFRDELEEPDSLEQEDCVYGTIGKTDIFFSEMFVKNTQGSHLNEFEMEDSTGKSLIFHGLFFEAKFAKNFLSRTFIMPNNFKTKVGLFNNWQGESIKLEDPDFASMFRVYGDSQVESRYLLSTSLMSRLVEFNKKAKRRVYLSFIDGFLYIAIPYRHRLFEPKLLQSMVSFQPLKEYFQDLELMIGIVEDLNLNRRIWGQ